MVLLAMRIAVLVLATSGKHPEPLQLSAAHWVVAIAIVSPCRHREPIDQERTKFTSSGVSLATFS